MDRRTLIRSAREARDWSQEELARRVGVSVKQVGRWERTDRPVSPSGKHAVALADVLGLSLRDLLTGSDETEAA